MAISLVEIHLPDGFDVCHDVSDIDENHLLYGNFIGLQYVFKSTLDERCLTKSIGALVLSFPALAGTFDAKNQTIIKRTETLSLEVKNSTGSYLDHSHIGTVQSDRCQLVSEPRRRDVLAGRAPLSTYTLTKFEGGGCILGIAISHVLTDAAGFHILVRRLAQYYSAYAEDRVPEIVPITSDLDVFAFGATRDQSETITSLKQSGLKTPMKIKGLFGLALRNIIIIAMDRMAKNRRVVIYFSNEHLQQLKQTVLEESGEDWISTNTALSAHFTRLMATLMYRDKAKKQVKIGQLLDLRGRYFDADRDRQDSFVGNAILIHTSKAQFHDGLQHTSRGKLARWFKNNISQIDATTLQTRLDLIADCLRHGYSYVGLEMSDPMIALNNQSKMPVYASKFGAAEPVRVIPQDVGDNIMFFPTRDGGIEVYIRDILKPKRQDQLLTDTWQKRVFDF